MSEDLIKRSDAIEALYKYEFVSKDVIEREIHAIPSADRPQGKWIDKEDFAPSYHLEKYDCYTICSNCHKEYAYRHRANYCAQCGAQMKGADDE